MLEYIRASAQSFGVKVAFGVIILVFVFWGIGNFNDRDYSNVVAVVNGEPILAVEFEKAYRNAEEYILRNNPAATREMLAREHLGRRVLNELIQLTLMSQEASRVGIEVSPVEMRLAVGQMKAFQDDNGKFDPDTYRNVLAAQRMSPAQYEKELASQMLRDKLFQLVTASVWVDPDEPLNRYNFLRERRNIDYIFIPAGKFSEQVKVDEAQIKSWYDAHLQDFAIPPRVNIDYIEVSPETLGDPQKISDEKAREWYEANRSRFEIKEQVRARHILVPVAEDADDGAVAGARRELERAKKQLAAGKTFASVADEFNSPQAAGAGGELGWIARGQTVPSFEEALFSLMPGQMSGEVRTPYGLHLILVEEKKAEGIQPFEEVSDQARKGAAYDEGADRMHEVLDNLIEDNILQKPLQQSAEKYGLKVGQSGSLDKEAIMQALGINGEGADAIFATTAGMPLDTALEAGDKYIVARIVASEPASTRTLDDVRDEIATTLKAEKTLSLAMEDAGKLLGSIRGKNIEQLKADNIPLHTGITMERGGSVPGFAPNTPLSDAIFASATGIWLPNAYTETGENGSGAMLVYVDDVLPPEAGEFESVQEIMVNGVKSERMEAIFDMFMQNLMDNAKIEVTNTNLVDRVNM